MTNWLSCLPWSYNTVSARLSSWQDTGHVFPRWQLDSAAFLETIHSHGICFQLSRRDREELESFASQEIKFSILVPPAQSPQLCALEISLIRSLLTWEPANNPELPKCYRCSFRNQLIVLSRNYNSETRWTTFTIIAISINCCYLLLLSHLLLTR